MAVSSTAVSVATTATALATGGSSGGDSVSVFHNGTADVFLGGSDVTTANGYPLGAGEHFSVDLERGEVLYGIVAAATEECRVIKANA